MDLTKFTTVGRPHIFKDIYTNTFHCSFVTEIYNNTVDADFMRHLKVLDFHVMEVGRRLRVRLPLLWLHIRHKKEEYIIDPVGNIRIIIDNINKRSIFNLLYTIGTETVVEGDNIAIYGVILKNGIAIHKELVDEEILIENLKKHGGDTNLFYSDVIRSTKILLETKYPLWKDPTAYWDEI